MPHDDHDEHAHALLPPEPALRVKALETILVRKGLIDPAAVDAIVDLYENHIGPRIGAGLVARAWADPAFKASLVNNTDGILAELGYGGRQGEHVVVVENTIECHNLVVCTLCSCYPWPLLGVPQPGTSRMPTGSGGANATSGFSRIRGRTVGRSKDTRLGLNSRNSLFCLADAAT